jgi:hypothetical protein
MWDKLSVVACHVQESPQCSEIYWNWPIDRSFYFGRICGHSTLRNYVTQLRNFLLSKCALAELDEELVVKQSLKNQLKMSYMILKSFTINQYIIHEDQHKFPYVLAKDSIHKTL